MPNPTIDKFQIGNTTYDFIDSTARNTADAAVPQTRKVNNKALSADVTLTSDDIGYDSTETYSSGTIGNELTQLSTAITQLDGYSRIEPDASPNNYRLKNNGNSTSNNQYMLIKYQVNSGDVIYIKSNIADALSDDRFYQFQDRETVSTSNNASHVVGTVGDAAYTGFLTVPVGATYLIISAKKTDTESGVYSFATLKTAQYALKTAKLSVNAQRKIPDAVTENWYLTTSGKCFTKTGNNIVKYKVTAGETVHIYALHQLSGVDATYQFQSGESIPAGSSSTESPRIGDTISADTISAVIVPDGADWLVINDADGTNGILKTDDIVKLLYGQKRQQAETFALQKTGAESYGKCDFCGIVVTDVHAQQNRMNRIVEIANYFGINLAEVLINCGDTVYGLASDDIDWYDDAIDNLSIPNLNVVGNHDAYSTLGNLGEKSVPYGKIISPVVTQNGIVQPTGAEANSLCYYYYDTNNVRIICIDCMYWDADEAAWFETVLDDAKTNSLAVICVSHYGFGGSNMTHISSLWREVDVPNNDALNIAAAEKIDAFIESGGEFVCWLVGHTHGDNIHKLSNNSNQLVLTFASPVQRASYLQKSDISTDYNFTVCTYITVDRYYKTVRLLRIGADIDVWGVKHEGVALNYQTGSLIAAY